MFTVISASDSLEPSYSDSLIYALLLMHHVERQNAWDRTNRMKYLNSLTIWSSNSLIFIKIGISLQLI